MVVEADGDAPLGRLSRRPWVLTGANGLLISSIAHLLARNGYPLLLHLHRRSDRLGDLLELHPGLKADLGSVEGRHLLVSQAVRLAPLGGLILGASRFQATPSGETPATGAILALDLEAPVELALLLAPHMAPGGRIVLFSDAGTSLGWPSYPTYLAAKGGIEAATRSLARRLGPDLVVLSVAPGALEGAPPPPDPIIEHRTALGRLGTVAETAEAILRFAALPPTVCHGQTLLVDGGRRLFP